MPKLLKYVLITVGSVITLLVAAIAIIAATFDPNDYKPVIIKLVHEKTRRTLSIPGEIKLTFFPRIGADLGKVSLSERDGTMMFASGEHASVSLALMPMFRRQFVVDRVILDGLTVSLHRFKDGKNNFDDLLPKSDGETAQSGGSQPAKLDIGGISVSNAALVYVDELAQRKIVVSKLNVLTGPIANGKQSHVEVNAEIQGDNPKLALKVAINSDFTMDLAQQHYRLNAFSASLNGAAAGFTDLQLKLLAPVLQTSATALNIPSLSLAAALTQGPLKASASLHGALNGDLDAQLFRSPKLTLAFAAYNGALAIKGTASTQLRAHMKSRVIDLTELSAETALPNPAGGTVALNAKGKATLNLAAGGVEVALAGKFDTSAFDAKLGVTTFSQPVYRFDIAIDELDTSRYATTGAPRETTQANGVGGPAKPFDLSALKSLSARGKVKVGTFKLAKLKATDVRLELLAQGGKVEVNPLAASLYGGSVAGSLSASAGSPPRFAVRQSLRNVNVGQLLTDAIDSAPIDGRGDVWLDIASAGNTVPQLKKELSGTARLELKDGAVKGVNLAQTLRHAKATVGLAQGNTPPQQGSASTQEKTDFTELSGSFKIARGVARNDDLSAKTPLMRIGGSGDIDLAEERLDYTVKATVVPSLQGQGGPEMQQMKGLTVPVKLSGPFRAISWKIDVAAMASDLARDKVEEKKAQVKVQAEKKIDEQKSKLEDQLKGQLKGLFGR